MSLISMLLKAAFKLNVKFAIHATYILYRGKLLTGGRKEDPLLEILYSSSSYDVYTFWNIHNPLTDNSVVLTGCIFCTLFSDLVVDTVLPDNLEEVSPLYKCLGRHFWLFYKFKM